MAIDKLSNTLPGIEGIQGLDRKQLDGKAEQVGTPKSFGEMLTQAVTEVNDLQLDAESKVESMVLGKDGVQSHDAMIALEKADVAFQLMNAVRGKIIRAYEQVMRTQV